VVQTVLAIAVGHVQGAHNIMPCAGCASTCMGGNVDMIKLL